EGNDTAVRVGSRKEALAVALAATARNADAFDTTPRCARCRCDRRRQDAGQCGYRSRGNSYHDAVPQPDATQRGQQTRRQPTSVAPHHPWPHPEASSSTFRSHITTTAPATNSRIVNRARVWGDEERSTAWPRSGARAMSGRRSRACHVSLWG